MAVSDYLSCPIISLLKQLYYLAIENRTGFSLTKALIVLKYIYTIFFRDE